MLPVVIQSVILGLTQAVTEFLPISSSAHLILARAVLDFGVVDGLTFDVALHMGTLAAIVLYFWGDLRSLARGFAVSLVKRSGDADPASRLAWYVLAACIPAGIVGFRYEMAIEVYFRHPAVIVVTLILGAVLFLWVEKRFKHDGAMHTLTLGRAMAIGLAQTLSLVPGVSRSGITIVTGMMCGLRRDESARFSFLMTSPLLLGAGIKKSIDLFGSGEPIPSTEIVALVVGVLTSGIAGWFVIRFLLGFLRSRGLQLFAYYRIVLALVVLAVLVF